ncbi:heterokaryon incompatibility domain-containing protein [Trichoderma evansii]
MNRWHKSSCDNPSVVVKNENPCCHACNSECNLKELASKKGSENSFSSSTPNEPPGQLNLSWPPSVPYIGLKKQGVSPPTNAQTPDPQLQDTQSFLTYGKTLELNEFRLACLSAPKHDDYPVHMTLETYKNTDCPEFETVSYTWGGEDGDHAPSQPVFTKNCWNMLRSIRPWRGVRLVWVDALCINQNNIKERGDQVAKMRQIYEECARVIVYLGTDVSRPAQGRFPHQRRLEDLDQHSRRLYTPSSNDGSLEQLDVAMRTLLQRRYFSRVWVIQELVTSPRAIMRVGDAEFSTDNTTASRLKDVDADWSWAECGAPWLRYMTQKSIQVEDLYGVLAVTSKSHATDLRDRLFGILGLIQRDDNEVAAWQPDYSLSAQHVFVGLLAHLIVNLKKIHLLLHASTLYASSSSPSWTPCWETNESWQSMFTAADFSGDEMISYISQFLSAENNCAVTPNLFTLENFESSQFLSKKDPCNKWLNDIFHSRPWDQDVAIHSDSGALSIHLTHLCTIPSLPIFRVAGPKADIFLASDNPLDSTVKPGQDHIFMLITEDLRLLYFILRESKDAIGARNYRLVGTSRSTFVKIADNKVWDRWIESLDSTITNTRTLLDKAFESFETRSIRAFFPFATTGWDMFPTCHGLYGKDASSNSSFEKAFLSGFDARFKASVADGFFEWEVTKGKDGVGRYVDRLFLQDTDERDYCDVEGFEKFTWKGRWEPVKTTVLDTEYSKEYTYSIETSLVPWNKTHRLRIPVKTVERAVRFFFASTERIQRCMKKDAKEIEAILRGDSSDQYRFLGVQCSLRWKKDFALMAAHIRFTFINK